MWQQHLKVEMNSSKAAAKIAIVILVLSICCILVSTSSFKLGDKLFFLQDRDPDSGQEEMKLVVVTSSPEDGTGKKKSCEVFLDQALIDEVLKSADDLQIRNATVEEMANLMKDCAEISRRKRRDSPSDIRDSSSDIRESRSQFDHGPPNLLDSAKPKNSSQNDPEVEDESTTLPNDLEDPTQTTEEGYNGWPVIWPGTKWCGAGAIAKGYDDLGLHEDTDKCCRAHDLCNDTLAPSETRNSLTNSSPFTKLSCKCDLAFYKCLDRIDSIISNSIGNLYFNVLKRRCYTEDYPTTSKCLKYLTFFKVTCKEYEKDTNVPMVYQWLHAKFYKKIPFPGPLTITLPF